jgi:hypothetical protein
MGMGVGLVAQRLLLLLLLLLQMMDLLHGLRSLGLGLLYLLWRWLRGLYLLRLVGLLHLLQLMRALRLRQLSRPGGARWKSVWASYADSLDCGIVGLVAFGQMPNLTTRWRDTMGSGLAKRRTSIGLRMHLILVQVHGGQVLERAIQRG